MLVSCKNAIFTLILVTKVFGQEAPDFYPSNEATKDQAEYNKNVANNVILHNLLKQQFAVLIYQDADKGRYLELNPANLNVPYDFDSDFYTYTGLERQGSEQTSPPGGSGGKLKLLEKLPHLRDLPALVQKYIHLFESEDCVDFPLEWVDLNNNGCEWYVNVGQCEQEFVPQLANLDHDAKQACCGCGGGRTTDIPTSCMDIEGWTDQAGGSCDDYRQTPGRCDIANSLALDGEPSASEACCACRPVLPPPTSPPGICTNVPRFADALGLACEIYEAIPSLCSENAARNQNRDGITAAQACCICRDLPPPVQYCSNPQISDSNAHIECGAVPYGDLCTFQCDENYELIGQHPIFCDDGVYHNLPECREKTCQPPQIEHSNAFSACGSVRHGLWCFLACEPFYEIVPPASGEAFPQCVEGQWSELPTCEAQVLCSSPPIFGADIDDLSACDKTPAGKFCVFTCNEGFRLQGGYPSCGNDGLWTKLPSCTPNRSCPIPPIDHSDVGTECTSVPEGSFCIFSCEEGYKKEGVLEVFCEEDESNGNLKWSSFPTCVLEVICPQPNIPNAKSTCSDITAGGACDVVCLDGFQISGEDPLCLEEGTWSALPSCTEVEPCGPLEIENSNSAVVCPSATYGEKCVFDCVDGFGLSRAEGVKCINSQWQTPLPFCDAYSGCNFPPIEHSDSSETCHMTPHGAVCRLNCDPGYEQTGVDLTCNDGQWEPNTETDCIPLHYCTSPRFENSNSYDLCAEAEDGDYCVFSCIDGYERDGLYPECKEDSQGLLQWSYINDPNGPPQCVEIPHCTAVDLIDTIVDSSPEYISENCDGLQVGGICVAVCKEGYERTGTRAVCVGHGLWNSNIQCEEILKCDPPLYEHSDSFSVCNYALLNEYCAFTCEEGYRRVGQYPQCLSVSSKKPEWTDIHAGCNPILQCSQPAIVNADENSIVKCHGANESDPCIFECSEGYKINGAFPTCQSNGNWTTLPKCVEIDTCTPLIIEYSDAECNTKQGFEECEFQCDRGWERNGSFPTCLPAADDSSSVRPQWSGTAECVKDLTCKLAPNIPFSDSNKCFNTATDSACDYICDVGYTAIGSVTCVDGEWYHQDVSLFFTDESLSTTYGAQCVVITPQNKINFLNRQLFRGDGKEVDFFSHYKTAIDQLERKFIDQAELNRIINETDEYRNELEDVEANCEQKFNSGAFSGYSSWEDLCDRLFFREILYVRRIDDKARELEELRKDDINDLKDRLNEYENNNKYIALVPDGVGKYTKRANWIATPSAKEMYDNLRRTRTNNSVYYEVTLTGNYSEFSSGNSLSEGQANFEELGRVNHIASYSNTSEFQTISYTETSTHMIINMEFRSWGRVQVRPDAWYDDTWTFKAEIAERQGRLKPGYTYSCEQPDCGNDTSLTGPNGVVYTRINELFVATDVSVSIKATNDVAQQIDTIMKHSSSIRVGPICSGAACHTTGNVIIGGDDLTDHGSSSDGVNLLGWLYIEQALKSIADNTFRSTSQSGVVAVLGSSKPSSSTNIGDAGSAILSAANAAGLTIWWYNDDSEIQRFFDELSSHVRDPEIIWIPGSGAYNDLDISESDALALNAMEINNFVDSGGGLLAHGEEGTDNDGAFAWLKELLPDVQVVLGESACDSSSARLTPAGLEKFKKLTNVDIRSGPCHGHFAGDWGNLEVLAYDAQDRPFIIGGYGGIIDTVEETQSTFAPQSITDDHSSSEDYYQYKNDVPQILLSAVTVV